MKRNQDLTSLDVNRTNHSISLFVTTKKDLAELKRFLETKTDLLTKGAEYEMSLTYGIYKEIRYDDKGQKQIWKDGLEPEYFVEFKTEPLTDEEADIKDWTSFCNYIFSILQPTGLLNKIRIANL